MLVNRVIGSRRQMRIESLRSLFADKLLRKYLTQSDQMQRELVVLAMIVNE